MAFAFVLSLIAIWGVSTLPPPTFARPGQLVLPLARHPMAFDESSVVTSTPLLVAPRPLPAQRLALRNHTVAR